MKSNIVKVVSRIISIKVTPIVKKSLENNSQKLVSHTYSGEYFPIYKNDNKSRVRNVNEYQSYD